jgi:hypothetical protein
MSVRSPFFEAALGGASSAYCAGFASCTAALASKNTSLIKETAVSDLWSAMNKVAELDPGKDHARPAVAGKYGRPDYFHRHDRQQWLGQLQRVVRELPRQQLARLTAISNFTWGRALGTAIVPQFASADHAADAV